jgi:hypothetical protein
MAEKTGFLGVAVVFIARGQGIHCPLTIIALPAHCQYTLFVRCGMLSRQSMYA